jgi:hypothetical protein
MLTSQFEQSNNSKILPGVKALIMTQYCFLRLKSDITQEEEKEWN